MLLIVLQWIYVVVLSFIYGLVTVRSVKAFTGKGEAIQLHPVIIIIMGLVITSVIASILHLVFPLTFSTGIILLVPGLIYAGLIRRRIAQLLRNYRREFTQIVHPATSFHWVLQGMIVFMCLVIVLPGSAMPPSFYDEGLYYMQFIKWMDSLAIVPGLGNLHPRLAFNSGWHVLSALHDLSGLVNLPLDDLNALLHLLIVVYGLGGLAAIFKRDYRLSKILRASLILPTHLLIGYLVGPSPDIPVVYLIWLIVVLFTEKMEEGSSFVSDEKMFVIYCFGLFALTIKLSALPVLVLLMLLPVASAYRDRKRQFFYLAFGFILILAPWLVRNVILSGYLIFPFPYLDLFHTDWKVPAELCREEASYIKAFAWGKSAFTSIPYADIHHLPFRMRISHWYTDLALSRKLILWFNLVILPVYLLRFPFLFFRGKRGFTQKEKALSLLFSTYLVGVLFWFCTAPDFRFGYAFTAGIGIWTLSLAFRRMFVLSEWSSLATHLLAAVLIIAYTKPLLDMSGKYTCMVQNTGRSFILTPGQAPSMDTDTYITEGGALLYISTCNDQCWDVPIPCTPYPDTGVELRRPDKGIAGGFVNERPDPLEYRKKKTGYQPLPDRKPIPDKCQPICE